MKRLICLALVFCFANLTAFAQDDQPTPEERAYKFRTSLFQTFSWKMGQLYGAQAAGDQAAFAQHANDLAMLAGLTLEGFQLKDSIPEGSKAKAEIWSDFDEFEKRQQNLIAAAKGLTQEGAMQDFKVRDFGSKNCGGCHRDFKLKD